MSLNAETTNTKLNELFIQLKECNSQKQSKILENKIWRLWETHPTNFQLTIDLKEGSRLAPFSFSWGQDPKSSGEIKLCNTIIELCD